MRRINGSSDGLDLLLANVTRRKRKRRLDNTDWFLVCLVFGVLTFTITVAVLNWPAGL